MRQQPHYSLSCSHSRRPLGHKRRVWQGSFLRHTTSGATEAAIRCYSMPTTISMAVSFPPPDRYGTIIIRRPTSSKTLSIRFRPMPIPLRRLSIWSWMVKITSRFRPASTISASWRHKPIRKYGLPAMQTERPEVTTASLRRARLIALRCTSCKVPTTTAQG